MSYLKTSKSSVLDMRYLHKYVFCPVRHKFLLISSSSQNEALQRTKKRLPKKLGRRFFYINGTIYLGKVPKEV